MNVGERLKRLRLAKGLSQEDLGKIFGVTKASIQKYETGQIRNFKIDTIKQFSEYFGLPPAYFIYDDIPSYGEDIVERLLELYLGQRAASFMHNLYRLNEDGLRKLSDYCKDLALIEKYKKEPS